MDRAETLTLEKPYRLSSRSISRLAMRMAAREMPRRATIDVALGGLDQDAGAAALGGGRAAGRAADAAALEPRDDG